jgi:hypothetical protein
MSVRTSEQFEKMREKKKWQFEERRRGERKLTRAKEKEKKKITSKTLSFL